MELSAEVCDLASQVLARSQVSNLCVFLYDTKPAQHAVKFLHNQGMSERVRSEYSRHLWSYDPFLRNINASGDDAVAGPRILERRQLEASDRQRRCEPYWRYMDLIGYQEIVAATHSIAPGLHMVAGVMRQSCIRGVRITANRVAADLEGLLQYSSSNYIAQLVRQQMHIDKTVLAEQARLPHRAFTDGVLTAREIDVVEGVRGGHGNKQIAAALGLSEYTIENHLKRIYRKFNVRSRTSLLAILDSPRM
ncbi:MAG: DNA-binding CsgD family transcriptional regulator [Zhongshania marina]|jgi:DNA-binding CsgD family transcriptional regulator